MHLIERTEVVVQARSLDRSRSGAVTGPIWLRHGLRDVSPADFPEAGWNDFPVVILAWWLTGIEPLSRSVARSAICSYMDGPFEFIVTTEGESLVQVRCVGRDATISEFRTRGDRLLSSMRAAATRVLSECDRRGWSDADIESLRRILAEADRN